MLPWNCEYVKGPAKITLVELTRPIAESNINNKTARK